MKEIASLTPFARNDEEKEVPRNDRCLRNTKYAIRPKGVLRSPERSEGSEVEGRNTQYEPRDTSVIFTGVREDLPEVYKAMDVFVLPSLREGVPMALLEAMAMEVPVIATNVGGVPYVIESEDLGLLVPPADAEALAEKILLLLRNPTLRVRMGEKAREGIVERFSARSLCTRYLEVYRKVVGARAKQTIDRRPQTVD
jgi:glycosyltransferase involved in cell wall biosynthesis